MNIIPVIRCSDIERSLSFYTEVLDFELMDPESDFGYRCLLRNNSRLDISNMGGDGVFGSKVLIIVDNLDELFGKFIERGLDLSGKSGVHRKPTDQSWGVREFYVDDPDGNTVRFGQSIG